MGSTPDDRLLELEESELFDDLEVSTNQPTPALAIPPRPSPPVRPRAALSDASGSSDSEDDGIVLDSDEELSERWTRDETYSLQSSAGQANMSPSIMSGETGAGRALQPQPVLMPSPFFVPGSLPSHAAGGPGARLARHMSNVEASLAGADAASALTLGTSMPISIPMMPRPAKPAARGEGPRFVPPHLLADGEGLGPETDVAELLGSSRLSPTTSFRRDKLTTRNAIMRATGFLEVPGHDMPPPVLETVIETDFQTDFLTQSALVGSVPMRAMARPGPGHRPTSSLTAMLGTPS
ncbi:hypothetical protein ACKKBG_A23085 [Auxenochlorella protothecoides x Auxenochlorella symbiontica]